MATDRGFVQSIDVGRGGLVTIDVLLEVGTVATYVISDLDGDPERFNERLSKLALLRDAMDRAEPVEIDHEPGPAGEEIDRAERITRDTLVDLAAARTVAGLVVGLVVHGQNQVGPALELPDYAEVALLSPSGPAASYRINLQVPERATAADQLALVRDAYAAGSLIRLTVGAPDAQGYEWVLEVASGNVGAGGQDGQKPVTVSGFVESLSLMPLTLPAPFNSASLASVGFTTAPDFTGPGGTVDTSPFTPTLLQFLVVEGSLSYLLFKAGLQENLRMEVEATALTPREGDSPSASSSESEGADAVATSPAAPATAVNVRTYLVVGAELLAPLASASRPVWIQIDREMLDKGPDGDCVSGVPSSDLTPQSLRDVGLPYTAVWRGFGCFNRGVYRFQIQPPAGVKVELDGHKLCLYQADEPGVQFAYACIEGDHEVKIDLEGWTCGSNFTFDVYRLR
jgi:hypothetical protein